MGGACESCGGSVYRRPVRQSSRDNATTLIGHNESISMTQAVCLALLSHGDIEPGKAANQKCMCVGTGENVHVKQN